MSKNRVDIAQCLVFAIAFVWCWAARNPLWLLSGVLFYVIATVLILSRTYPWRRIAGVLCLSVLILTISVVSGALLRFSHRFFLSASLYFLAELFLLRHYAGKMKIAHLLALTLGIEIVLLTITSLKTDFTYARPLGLAPILGCVLALLVFRWENYRWLVLASLCFIGALSYWGYPNYIAFFSGKQCRLDASAFTQLKLLSERGEPMTLGQIKSKVIVIDFWFAGCGVCFEEFPKFEAVYRKYKGDKNVYIASLYLPSGSPEHDSVARARLNKYSFNKLVSGSTLEDNYWGIKAFPTVWILDAEKRIVYQGGVNTGGHIVFNNINSMVEAYH